MILQNGLIADAGLALEIDRGREPVIRPLLKALTAQLRVAPIASLQIGLLRGEKPEDVSFVVEVR